MKKKNLLLVICIAMVLTLVPQVTFATDNEENMVETTRNFITIVDGSTVPENFGNDAIEPKSRWYSEIITVKENVPFTEYNAAKTRKVVGIYTQKALYFVYRDGSGKRIHQHDTYYYTWTGYKKSGSSWIKMSDYVDVKDTIIDRGPVRELFGILM